MCVIRLLPFLCPRCLFCVTSLLLFSGVTSRLFAFPLWKSAPDLHGGGAEGRERERGEGMRERGGEGGRKRKKREGGEKGETG